MKPGIFLTSAAASVALLSLGLTGCKSGGGDTIKVGEFASLTGKEATFGTSSHEGTLLAVEEINAAGGVLGKKIELLTEDDQTKAGEPANAVNKLISKDGVVAILGEVASSRSLEAAPICQQGGIPMISPASTNPSVTQVGDHIFRVCFTDTFQGGALANFATEKLNAKKVAVLTDTKSDYSKGLAKNFKEKYLKNGGQIVTELDFNGGDKDFKGQLTTIKNAAPDAIFLPGYYTDVALIAIQAKQLGISIPLFGGDGWESETLLTIGKEAMNGNYFSTHCAADQGTPKMTAFVDAYKKRFNGKTPDAMAVLGYDSAMVLADSIKRAGSTEGAKLRDAIAATKDYEGVSGKFSLNADRDAVKALVFIKIENGAFKYSATVNP
ncbi:ABC transporter substrate-binding protein [Luteolibacter ambystomatis]|uniref:ABC transporter substrate-binding protein n=1 Tax=Luteolibacter ambystomatis TaxID=2824561 RepID=A0A975G7Y2_9BACT|nr:ABC transporter substrate-binding protein [Luteolibacter ambystomatis]QUE50739.1 ABC transporter substrate-binding protein [Luteolibacter ambystomatis]